MVFGIRAEGDYFIDCGNARLAFVRAVFGAWITISSAIIAICVRSFYRSQIRKRVITWGVGGEQVNLWNVSPATSPSEAFALRNMLGGSLLRGEIFYVTASLIGVVAAIISAFSTTISNHAVVTNMVTRAAVVPGQLTTQFNYGVEALAIQVNTSARINALVRAGAPLEELFDFVPNDTFHWIYVEEEWNNTWRGRCTYNLHPAVDLVIFPDNSGDYRSMVPSLGTVLPHWATVNSTQTGYDGFGINVTATNQSGVWKDCLLTYAFGSTPTSIDRRNTPFINISFANLLLHGIPAPSDSTFAQTAFRSDVHVVDCAFDNVRSDFNYQTFPAIDDFDFYARIIGGYHGSVREATPTHPVVQPTAQQMLRIWQAYLSVKDVTTGGGLPVQRRLSISLPAVQIRLSAIVSTAGALLLTLAAATISRHTEPRDQHGKRLKLPSSQLDWMVQAAREHYRGCGDSFFTRSSITYAAQHRNLVFVTKPAYDGQPITCIASPTKPPDTSYSRKGCVAPLPDWITPSPGWEPPSLGPLSMFRETFPRIGYHQWGRGFNNASVLII